MSQFDIVGICGSLRARSLNRMVLSLAAEAMPSSMSLDILDWSDVPPFNADVLAARVPDVVHAVRERIRRADAVVIATPEYNFSIPGMLKNLLDWISRGDDQPLAHKPVAILTATPGPLGGARVQYDLRKVLLFMNAMVLVKPEVFIGHANGKFTELGVCSDQTTREFVTSQMQALERWIEKAKLLQ